MLVVDPPALSLLKAFQVLPGDFDQTILRPYRYALSDRFEFIFVV